MHILVFILQWPISEQNFHINCGHIYSYATYSINITYILTMSVMLCRIFIINKVYHNLSHNIKFHIQRWETPNIWETIKSAVYDCCHFLNDIFQNTSIQCTEKCGQLRPIHSSIFCIRIFIYFIYTYISLEKFSGFKSYIKTTFLPHPEMLKQ